MATLATFGDSWPAGAELLVNEKPFGQLLAAKLLLEFQNFSQPSTSLEHLVLQLTEALETKKIEAGDTCVFFLTARSRSIYFNNNRWKELNDHNPSYVHIYSEELSIFRSNLVLLSLQNICKQYNLQDFYISGWEKFQFMLPGILTKKLYNEGTSHCLNFFKVFDNDPTDDPSFIFYHHNHYIRPNQCHPNQLGHQIIADKLFEWITHDTTFT